MTYNPNRNPPGSAGGTGGQFDHGPAGAASASGARLDDLADVLSSEVSFSADLKKRLEGSDYGGKIEPYVPYRDRLGSLVNDADDDIFYEYDSDTIEPVLYELYHEDEKTNEMIANYMGVTAEDVGELDEGEWVENFRFACQDAGLSDPVMTASDFVNPEGETR